MRYEENLLTEGSLRQLVEAHAIEKAEVIGATGGFILEVVIGGGVAKTLSTARGAVRRFATVDTAGVFLKQLGLPTFEVDMTDFSPGRIRSARPDRAAALRNTRTQPKQQNLV